MKEHDSQGPGRISGSSGIFDSSHPPPEQSGFRILSDRSRNAFGAPVPVSLGSLQPPVCAKSLFSFIQVYTFFYI